MPFEPERIEAIAQSLESQAQWVMLIRGGMGLLLCILGALGFFAGVTKTWGAPELAVVPGVALAFFGLSVVSSAQSEAARLRLGAQYARLGIVIEANTRRMAAAVEWMVQHLGEKTR